MCLTGPTVTTTRIAKPKTIRWPLLPESRGATGKSEKPRSGCRGYRRIGNWPAEWIDCSWPIQTPVVSDGFGYFYHTNHALNIMNPYKISPRENARRDAAAVASSRSPAGSPPVK